MYSHRSSSKKQYTVCYYMQLFSLSLLLQKIKSVAAGRWEDFCEFVPSVFNKCLNSNFLTIGMKCCFNIFSWSWKRNKVSGVQQFHHYIFSLLHNTSISHENKKLQGLDIKFSFTVISRNNVDNLMRLYDKWRKNKKSEVRVVWTLSRWLEACWCPQAEDGGQLIYVHLIVVTISNRALNEVSLSTWLSPCASVRQVSLQK